MKYSSVIEAAALARRVIRENDNNPFATGVDEFVATKLTIYPRNFQAQVRAEIASARKFKKALKPQ